MFIRIAKLSRIEAFLMVKLLVQGEEVLVAVEGRKTGGGTGGTIKAEAP
jgi:hypothetical protein